MKPNLLQNEFLLKVSYTDLNSREKTFRNFLKGNFS